MRTVRRPNLRPPTLQPDGSGGAAALANQQRASANPPAAPTFPPHWNNPDVRGVLYAIQWRVCAYCCRYLPSNDRGDVEHYRPKNKVHEDVAHGGYWWVAYDLDNYFLSCSICNSHRKGTRFPLRPRAQRITYATRSRLVREARALWDPAADPLDDWLTVDWQDPVVPVHAHANLSRVRRSQVTESVRFFRINVDPSLVSGRRQAVDKILDKIEDDDDHARSLAVRYRPHSLVARAVLREIRPALLPTPSDELEWLLSDLLRELETLVALMEREPEDERNRVALDEAYWCLACLLAAPPEGEGCRIESFCNDLGILEEVRPRASRL